MVVRKPFFGQTDARDLLEAVRGARSACCLAGSQAGFGSPVYQACSAVKEKIDELAGLLANNREYFWVNHPPAGKFLNQAHDDARRSPRLTGSRS